VFAEDSMRYTVSPLFRSAVHASGIPKYKLAARGGLLPNAFGNYLRGLPFGPIVRQRIAHIGDTLGCSCDVSTLPFQEPFTPVLNVEEVRS
jgi:hypothetical protein